MAVFTNTDKLAFNGNSECTMYVLCIKPTTTKFQNLQSHQIHTRIPMVTNVDTNNTVDPLYYGHLGILVLCFSVRLIYEISGSFDTLQSYAGTRRGSSCHRWHRLRTHERPTTRKSSISLRPNARRTHRH